MRKFVLIPILILSVIMIVSFVPISDADDAEELVVKVTADKVTEFDMFKYANPENPKTIKGLKTPYEFTVRTLDGQFIFKSKNSKAELKVEVRSKTRGSVTGQWPIVVVLATDLDLSTFGID